MRNLKFLKRFLIWANFVFLILQPQLSFAQLDNFLTNMNDTSNYYNIRGHLFQRIDSLRNTMDSATFYAGCGEYKAFKKFDNFWAPRLFPHGKLSKYSAIEEYFFSTIADNYDYYTEEPWVAIGPFRNNENDPNDLRGIGPTEFIEIFNDGTLQSTQHMLTASIPGGLFYSSNGGENWSNGGTDKWERSSVGSAVFNPLNSKSWFASSGGGGTNGRSVYILRTGGIYRTYDKGEEWTKIADYHDLGGEWNVIYKIEVNPSDTNMLYAVTRNGIYRTIDSHIENPSWIKVLEGFAFDLEFKPSNSNLLYATVFKEMNDTIWKIFKSNDQGSNWTPINNQPPHTLDNIVQQKQTITIEMSKGKPDNLYCLVRDYDSVFVYYAEMNNGGMWNLIGSHYDNFNYGDGHGFGVDQIQGQKIIVSFLPKLKMYEIGGFSKDFTLAHMDCEDVVFHPYAMNKVWLSTHGGIEVIENVTTDIFSVSKNYGLAIGQVQCMATSNSNLGYIIAGFDHHGCKLTDGKYTNTWDPTWKFVHVGDGMQPIIDPKTPNYMWASTEKGNWSKSSNYFIHQTTLLNPATPSAYWTSCGVLNKFKPNVFYRNNLDLTYRFEDVYRSTTRGEGAPETGKNEYISDFASDLPIVYNQSIVNKIVTSNSNQNSILVHVIARIASSPPQLLEKHQLWINQNALDIQNTAINAWEQITLPRNGWISDMLFHPDDHEKFYLVYSSPENVNSNFANKQIFLIDNTDGIPVYQDITKGNLPNCKLGSLIVITNDPTEYFISSDYGVFYTNDQMTGWERVGTALPYVNITGLEINPFNRTLRVGTYGRGIWELSLPCEANSSENLVQSDTQWDSPRFLSGNLRIANGATLTLGTNAIVAMPDNKKIIIEQGSKLVVDGARITNSCDLPWSGIEVWGNSTASQIALPGQPCLQGKLILKNGATIENAYNAVALWKPGDYSKTGGIIQAKDAIFRNNKRSVEFISYQNFNPLDSTELFSNASYFTNCSFVIDENYMIPSPFNAHITMWQVDGIQLKGNTFQGGLSGNFGKGIYSIDAHYQLLPYCNSQTVPCPSQSFLLNSFTGFDAAVEASNSQSLRSILVDQAYFYGNGYGVKLNAINNASITRSNFIIRKLSQSEEECETAFGMGIELTNCTNYFVEENTFTSSGQLGGALGTIGIRVANDAEFSVNPTTIYKNQFNGVERANLAEGKNRTNHSLDKGLVYECNANSFNGFDFYFTGQGVAGKQGSLSKAAGNTFSTFSTTPQQPVHISNLAENHVDYYYAPATNQQPLYTVNVTPQQVSTSHGCPSSFGGGGGEIELMGLSNDQQTYFEEKLATSRTAYNSLSNLYNSLVDGGNSSTMISAVETAWPNDMWELRAQLLQGSPHLSKEVLKKAADRTDVLPESIIFEVLSANPDELKDNELMEFLQTKSEPLPEYMMEVLESLKGNITYKTILQSQMAHYSLEQAKAERALLHNLVHDSISNMQALRTQLAAAQSLPMDMQIVDAFMQEGKTSEALSLANMLPQLYGLTAEALTEHNRFVGLKQLQTGLQTEGRNIFTMNETEKSTLIDMINQSTGLAGIQARNIMAFIGEYEYCDCPSAIDASLKTKTVISATTAQSLLGPTVEAHPNPANSWVGFVYTLEGEKAVALLEICDATGKTVHHAQLNQKQGEYVWDTRQVKAGTYYYSLKTGGSFKTGKVVIVK